MLNSADSTNSMITIDDFEDPRDRRAAIFVDYARICQILGDLCQGLTRHGRINHMERNEFSCRLQRFLHSLPDELLIAKRGYDFELAQLHVPILSTISILHRPRSVFAITSVNAASVVAGNLSFRLFQAMELRGQTKLLSSAFAWHLMAASIPHLSALRIRELSSEANYALDELEKVFSSLGKVRPAAQQNLRNVRAIRCAVLASRRSDPSRRNTPESMPPDSAMEQSHTIPEQLLQIYGQDVIQHYHRIVAALQDAQSEHTEVTPMQSGFVGNLQPPLLMNVDTPGASMQLELATPIHAYQDLFSNLFGDSLQDNVWMRDWMDDLRPMPE
jgi:hypothetical protein